MREEEWRDVVGYEGLYQVSSKGRVKSLNYRRTGKEKVLKLGKDNNGYLTVGLHKEGKVKWCTVHRLVATAFIPNIENLPEVNHIDECKTNSNVENLEWCTREYNISYGTKNKRAAEANTGKPKLSKPVIAISKESGLIMEYPSVREASRQTGISNGNIVNCCKGKRKSCGGYYWMYSE